MRSKNIILLVVVAFIGGLVFFFACKHICDSKLATLKDKAKNAFILALDKSLRNREIEIPFSSYSDTKSLATVNIPDSVAIIDESGKHWYKFYKERSEMNVASNVRVRSLHSYTFGEHPLVADSLNIVWGQYLSESYVSAESALCISIMDQKGRVKSQNSLLHEWCSPSNLVLTAYIGYACEIEVKGYIDYSIWSMIYVQTLLCLLLYIAFVYGGYQICIVVQNKIVAIRQKNTIEVLKIVREIDGAPTRSYKLKENILFYAEQKILEVNGVEQKISKQTCELLELFLLNEDQDYKLEDEEIMEKLWPDGSGYKARVHKAVGRLRNILFNIDSSIEIKRGIETYQLLF